MECTGSFPINCILYATLELAYCPEMHMVTSITGFYNTSNKDVDLGHSTVWAL